MSVAGIMREKNISSVVVCENGAPTGIVTDRDLRNKVVARGDAPRSVAVRTIMNAPLITVGEEDFLFEALYRMSRHGIHRVGVVDVTGKLTGIVTDSDVLRLQTRSPQRMIRDIEEADTVEELKSLHARVQGLVLHLVGTGAATRDLVRMIALLNDRILLRLIALLRKERFPHLPEGFAFVVLGSEGRREQTLATDQDNAIILADGLSGEEMAMIEDFSRELIDSLIAIGVPSCPGGIMAKNVEWRRSVKDWTHCLDDWFSNATPENILKGSMFLDLRALWGDSALEKTLKTHIAANLHRNAAFLAHMGANVLRFPPPLGWFGRIKTEKRGKHRGQFDVKKAGIFAVTEGVKVLALENGFLEGGTRERLQHLGRIGVLDRQAAEDLEATFDFLVFMRLRAQVTAIRAGREPSNFISLDHLNRMEKGRLQLALEGVKSFQGFLKRHFRLEHLH
jgi:CBS domain-containing protein